MHDHDPNLKVHSVNLTESLSLFSFPLSLVVQIRGVILRNVLDPIPDPDPEMESDEPF